MRYYLMINGIEVNPSDRSGWEYRAVQWILNNTPDRADCYAYHVGVDWPESAGVWPRACRGLRRWKDCRFSIPKLSLGPRPGVFHVQF